MNSKFSALALLVLITVVVFATTGCTPVDTGLGGATRHDTLAQTVDPEPKYDGELIEGADGERGSKAVARYRKGEVKQPANVSTTVSSGRGGGGSGAGASTSSGG